MFDGFKPKPIERPAPGRVQGEKPKRGMFDGLKLDATPATPSPARADRGEDRAFARAVERTRSEEHTSELQSLMRISYAVFCLKKKNTATSKANCGDKDTVMTLRMIDRQTRD